MANFHEALQHIWRWEGKHSNDPRDPGGDTWYGISRRAHPGIPWPPSKEDAERIYREKYWYFDGVRDQDVATKLFDMAVNMGPETAIKHLQVALRSFGLSITLDGDFGPQTLKATNLIQPREVLKGLRLRQIQHYLRLEKVDNPFLRGWLNRAVDL